MDGFGFFNPFQLLFGMGLGARREDPVLAKATRWEPMATREERIKLVEDHVRSGCTSRSEAWRKVHRQTCRLSHRLKYPRTVRMLAEMEARMEFLEWLRDVE